MIAQDLDAGVRNLLVNCADVRSGETLLIVQEDPEFGWYDLAASEAVAAVAKELGLSTTVQIVGEPGEARDPAIMKAVDAHDRVIFLARIGDQDRFEASTQKNPSVMSYARDAAALASAYGRTDHRAMVALKEAVNDILRVATEIEITCPLGTRVAGSPSHLQGENSAEVTVKRFPMGVPQPVLCDGFTGRVALSRYLTPTGSKAYTPPDLPIDGTVFAHVDGNRIARFEGDAEEVAAIENHYRHVASLFQIDPFVTHSWHAGIHPGCYFSGAIDDDPDRWANNIFTHPRLLHFHTCGAYAPGEICWSVLDPTVRVDGVALWDDGALKPDRFSPGRRCLSEWPELETLLAAPSTSIGVDG